MTKRVAFILLALAAASVGPAHAADDPACAKYEDPLAYNACLASHGPKATDLATSARPAQATRSAPVQPERVRPAAMRSARGWPHAIRGRGRAHMEFRVK
jgi:hypothetical protein